MRDFILDTQTIRYWNNIRSDQYLKVIGNVTQLREAASKLQSQPKLLISVISLGEIEYGHRVASDPDPDAHSEFANLLNRELPESFDLSKDAAEAYGELRARLFNKFAPGKKRKRRMPSRATLRSGDSEDPWYPRERFVALFPSHCPRICIGDERQNGPTP